MHIRTTTAAIVAITTLAGAPGALAGDLTPPGAPAPTMKPLDQVEPRIPITAADMPLTISQPGSYYFVESITTAGNGISIQSDDVTLDLGGFAFRGGTGSAIGAGAFSNITIRNGTIADWGGGGVVISSTDGAIVENIQVRDVFTQGIWTGNASLIRGCTVVRAVGSGSSGTYAVAANEGSRIVDTVSRDSGGGGIWVNGSQGAVEGCTATQSAGAGFLLGDSGTMIGCRAVDNGDDGIIAELGSSVIDSVSFSNDQAGIDAATGVVMTRVNVRGNQVNGIVAADACTITDST
ncbi:MAG: right-handed parallel beta-helix repeat-containing protein, partial [Phycisphaerales bacterium]